MPKSRELLKISYDLREDVIDMLVEAGSGHTAGALGSAEIITTLFFEVMGENDKFVLSNGHECPILYAALARKGYFPKEELKTLRKFGTRLEGHPVFGKLPGINFTSGSLGQGLSQAIGMALAEKLNGTKNRVFCLTGDGELQEGQIWEAAMFAPNKNVDNLMWFIDRNNIQIDGRTEEVMPVESLREKLEAFKWYVIEVDGHDIDEIISSCRVASTINQRPTVVIAHTTPGKGVDFMENQVEWHGLTPNRAQAAEAIKQLRAVKGKIEA